MRLAKLLGIGLVAASSACLSVNQNGSGAVLGRHAGCELTMQSNTLGGACGELVLHNTGSATMHGWQIEFTLPAGGHLVNTWNALFSANDNAVLVKPLDNEMVLTPGQSITMGYCATGPASNIVLTAGLCDGSVGDTASEPGEPAGDRDNEPSDPNLTASTAVSLAPTVDANAACPLDAQLVGSQGALSVYTGGDNITRCAEARSSQTFIYGTFSAEMQGAAKAGVVVQFATSANTASGAQGVAVALDGNDVNAVWIGLTHDGISNAVRVPVSFDTSNGTRTYSIVWAADRVMVRADGAALVTFTTDLPPAVGASLSASATIGTGSGAPSTFNGIAQGYVSNVRYASGLAIASFEAP